MNIGIDLHDTFTYNPQYFAKLISTWPYKKYIVSGTPEADRISVENILKAYNINVDGILLGFDYNKNSMNYEHFNKMAKHKLKLLKDNDITIYYDDNPFYASYLRNFGVTVFQTIMSNDYINLYKEADPYFSSHLQERQFDFLKDIK